MQINEAKTSMTMQFKTEITMIKLHKAEVFRGKKETRKKQETEKRGLCIPVEVTGA